MIAIYLFTELSYFNGQNTANVIQKTIKMNETSSQHHVSPTEDSLTLYELNLIFRKSAHVIVFGILAFLFFNSLRSYRVSYVFAWLLTVSYAIFDEWHQSFIAGRVSSVKDVLFDGLGAFFTLLIVYFFIRWKKTLPSKNETVDSLGK